MAAKIRMLKLLQEIRGFAEIANRRPHPRQPGLFLMQLRAHIFSTSQTGHKRIISIDMQDLPDIPHPVKITHLKVPARAVSGATLANPVGVLP